nr:MAG TPA: hypothetical protein [Caudoviricetes sp.]
MQGICKSYFRPIIIIIVPSLLYINYITLIYFLQIYFIFIVNAYSSFTGMYNFLPFKSSSISSFVISIV